MLHEPLLPAFDLVGMAGFIVAGGYAISNYRASDVERPLWLAFAMIASLGSLWLVLVALEWVGFGVEVMNQFSTTLQAVVIGLYAIGIVGTQEVMRELNRSRAEISKRASIVSVLSRVLRHNIRNDITIIRGYMLTDGGEAVVQRTIDNLIATSEKARKLEQTLAAEQDTEVAIGAIVEDVVDELETAHPDATIRTEFDGGTERIVPLPVRTALEELVENAIVHGDDHPAVTVTVDVDDRSVRLTVADDGPGLPIHERHLLETDEESALFHSSGIGLWMAGWIIENHGGRLEATVSDTGTEMSISLPDQDRREARFRPDAFKDVIAEQDRYRAAFQDCVDACLIFDDEGRVLDANRAAGDLLDTDRTHLLGRPVTSVLDDDLDVAAIVEALGEADTVHRVANVTDADTTVPCAFVGNVVVGEHLLVVGHASAD